VGRWSLRGGMPRRILFARRLIAFSFVSRPSGSGRGVLSTLILFPFYSRGRLLGRVLVVLQGSHYMDTSGPSTLVESVLDCDKFHRVERRFSESEGRD
jgi:hypothetical protein